MRDHPFYRDFRRFYVFIKPYKWRALAAMLLAIPVGSMEAVIAYILKPFTNDILIGSGDVDLSYFPLLIIGFTLVQSMFKFSSNYLTTWSGTRIANDLKMALFDKLMHSDTALFDKSTSGEVLLRYHTDAETASSGLISNITLIINRFFTSVALVAVLFALSWILALVAVAALLLAVAPMNRVRKRIKQIIQETVKAGAVITTNYNEAFNGNRTVATYNLYDNQMARLRGTLSNLFSLAMKMVKRIGFMSLSMHFSVSLGIAAVVWLQGYLIMKGYITPGDFVAFMVALLMLYTPVKSFSNNFGNIMVSMTAIGRVLEKLDQQPTIVDKPNAKPLDGVRDAIRYRAVSFEYEPGKPVLRNIDLEVRAGQSVAFVGNSGGGKTTLVNLLPRLYDATSGAVTVDGVDVRDLDLASLRDNIAIVFQDNFLFGGTIRENILLGKAGAGDADMERAVKAACLDEFVGSLEHGLDTQIGERGIMLSGGQKQRVAIARAFIKDAPVVILDEATSALDNKSETVVQRAIENLMRNKTVLIIAHRLSTVINADRIVVIKDGEMVESGTHAELMARPDGMYASLYKTQLW